MTDEQAAEVLARWQQTWHTSCDDEDAKGVMFDDLMDALALAIDALKERIIRG